MKKIFLLALLFAGLLPALRAQLQSNIGIHVSGGQSSALQVASNIGTNCNATGQNSFAGGNLSIASEQNAFAFGYASQATQQNTYAIGLRAVASGSNSMSLGFNVSATLENSIVIGSGYGSHDLLTSGNYGITLGMGSTLPTMQITRAGGSQMTGSVAIGNVTPHAKLHIHSDELEDANIILEPEDRTRNSASIFLLDDSHYITASPDNGMSISAGNQHMLGVNSMNFKIANQLMDLGASLNDRHLTFETQGTPSIGCNAHPDGYSRPYYGPSYVMEFGNMGFLLRTSAYVPPTLTQTSSMIDNWTDALSVKTNGAITLNGKVGVNIENTYAGYALAVDGGILTTKVRIKEVDQWPDHVFGDGYRLMSLGEVEDYVAANRHLPGVPSEAEVKVEGYDVAEMQAVLLGKIEELTLHVIRQQKEIDSLRTLVTVSFGYDACGNRTSRAILFSKGEPDAPSRGGTPVGDTGQWQASLSDLFGGVETSLFPNPTEGGFILSIAGEIPQGVKAVLCTMDGKVVEERTVSNATEEFDLGGKPAGIYLLRLVSDREAKVWKVVKRN